MTHYVQNIVCQHVFEISKIHSYFKCSMAIHSYWLPSTKLDSIALDSSVKFIR